MQTGIYYHIILIYCCNYIYIYIQYIYKLVCSTNCFTVYCNFYRQMSINENKKLTDELVVFTVGWIFYQSSFYYLSNETKNWTESRRYCTEKGADLIIINNREEYDFVQNMSAAAVVYIGLTDSDVEGSWKWVYVSYRTESSTEHLMLICTFSSWASGQPNGDNKVDEDCAVTVAVPRPAFLNLVGWHDVACNRAFQWICEKRISQFMLP
uniref:C-type lectin domain-containing protein n=1 Tax=Sinocyclocheilus anshuiensis TaxID=1608454 RepID=A0A671L6C4_9TELE